MAKNTQLIRTCAACGLEKPLSAFLQVGGTQGSNYGNICSTCRGTGRTAPVKTEPEEKDTNGGARRHRIGTKEKVYAEKEQKRQIKDLKELFKNEAKRREELALQKAQTTEIKEKAEKDHRTRYLDTKQSFLGKKLPSAQENKGYKAQDIARQNARHANERNETNLESVKQEELVRQELQITSSDLAVPYIDPQTWHLRYQGENFLRFKAWLGTSSPIVRALERLQLHGKKMSGQSPIPQDVSPKQESEKPKDFIDEYLDKRLGPSSRKR